jgi:hypothetical protein
MATAKKKFVAIQSKLDFWERRENAFFHKVLSRVPKLSVGEQTIEKIETLPDFPGAV